MKKNADRSKIISLLTTLVICIVSIGVILAGCASQNSGNSDNKTPAHGDENTDTAENTPIIVTMAPTDAPAPEQETNGPAKKYVDLLEHREQLDFSASSVESEYSPGELSASLSFDGNDETRWSSIFYDVEGCWICAQFPYPVSVHSVEINENKTWGQMMDWEAQYYDLADNTWKTIYSDTTSDEVLYEFSKDTPETYAFRLLFLEGTGITITINEIGLTGLFAEVPEGTEPKAPINFRNDVIIDAPEELYLSPAGWIFNASSREAEGTESELGPVLCFDENDKTRWSTVFGDLYGAWISADFGKEIEVNGFAFRECKTWGHVTDFEAQVMVGGEWKKVYSGQETDPSYIELAEPVKCTGFRLVFNDGETISETVTIWEISLYGRQ